MICLKETIPRMKTVYIRRSNSKKSFLEQVRFQPWTMKKKLKITSTVKDYLERYEGKLSKRHGCWEKFIMSMRRFKRSLNDFAQILIPWEMKVKAIESHFGSVVSSYFVFLRWLMWINIWLAALPGSVGYKTIPDDERQKASQLKSIWDAEGIVKYSPLFYGYYGHDKLIGNSYRLPLAYMIIGLAGFAFSFIVVLRQMAANSKRSGLSGQEENFTFSRKLFSGWDFTIGHPETSTNKYASIVTGFKESILEEKQKSQEQNKKLLTLLRILANIIVLMLLALSTYIIQLCVERSREVEINHRRDNLEIGFWEQQELTVVMTLIATLFPTFFDIVSIMEKYHPRVNLRWQLARIFGLNLLNLYTLFIALFWKQEDLKRELHTILMEKPCNTTESSITMPSMDHINCSIQQETLDSSLCWETMIGQEVFKLTVMDLVFVIGTIIIQEFLRGLCVRYFNPVCCWDMEQAFPEYADFHTAENILHLISNQGIIWLGTFFAPGLPLLNLAKLFILLYLRSWSVMVCNVPQEGIFRASRSNNFYYALLLVMLFLSMLPPLFAIVAIEPSPHCGPFSGQKKMFEVISNYIDDELPSSMTAGINYAASPGVIIPLLMLLGMTIYYLVSVNKGLKESNKGLKKELQYERTEGKQKIYAMANVKRDLESGQSKAEKKDTKMSGAAYSVIAAKRIAKLLNANKDAVKMKLKPHHPSHDV
ncbi:TMC [Mytilus edulis]|uniref:TMC n=1 Tax=Mytilus edulis TaxID=6550 RepID=A0A8S3V566_MYTED|nr:TMC [Mytilus edulis]